MAGGSTRATHRHATGAPRVEGADERFAGDAREGPAMTYEARAEPAPARQARAAPAPAFPVGHGVEQTASAICLCGRLLHVCPQVLRWAARRRTAAP